MSGALALLLSAAAAAGPPDRPPVVGPIVATPDPNTHSTRYTATASDPERYAGLSFQWSLTSPPGEARCRNRGNPGLSGNAASSPVAFLWYHGPDDCSHGSGAAHAGVVTLAVTDRHWRCTAAYSGSTPGAGPAPTCALGEFSAPITIFKGLKRVNQDLAMLIVDYQQASFIRRPGVLGAGLRLIPIDLRLVLLNLPAIVGLKSSGDVLSHLAGSARLLEEASKDPDATMLRNASAGLRLAAAGPPYFRNTLVQLSLEARRLELLVRRGDIEDDVAQRRIKTLNGRLHTLVRKHFPKIWGTQAHATLADLEAFYRAADEAADATLLSTAVAAIRKMKRAVERIDDRVHDAWALD